MKVTCIYWPGAEERHLFLDAVRTTDNKDTDEGKLPSEGLIHRLLDARHSPIRIFQFAFRFEDIPSNTATHLCRHVHATPFVSTLRNDRQGIMDGDTAPRNTPVNMIFYCNAEELMTIANKRLCKKAAPMTRQAVKLMCMEALGRMPELTGLLVPMCVYRGGKCHEINGCGRCPQA